MAAVTFNARNIYGFCRKRRLKKHEQYTMWVVATVKTIFNRAIAKQTFK